MNDRIDWDDAYANRAHIPDADDFIARWPAEAAAFRAALQSEGRLEEALPYGPHPRQKFDLMLPQGAPEGLVVFVHGGYWRDLDRGLWSHFAEGALVRGHAVAMPGYVLTPEVTIAEITAMIRTAIDTAAARIAGPVRLVGHSAGGHLVSRMACPDALPGCAARIAGIVPISPVSDLRPLIRTAMNADLGLDEDTARAESPALMRPALGGVPVTVWVGGDERPVFLDQARWLAEAWPEARLMVEPGRHHFDVIDGLRDPGHPLMHAVIGAG